MGGGGAAVGRGGGVAAAASASGRAAMITTDHRWLADGAPTATHVGTHVVGTQAPT